MAGPRIYPVILAGGASSRLWPMSDSARPKWDLRLFGGRSLIEEAWVRARAVAPAERCFVVAGAIQARRIRAALPELPAGNRLLEPGARDTAGAVAYAAGAVARRDPEGVLLVLPGDHLIAPLERFARCADAAARLAVQEDALVTFGILPRGPRPCYGYVRRGEPVAWAEAREGDPAAFRVRSFKEKPALRQTQLFVRSGEWYWNGGIFALPLRRLTEEFAACLPGHAEFVRQLAAARSAEDAAELVRTLFPRLEKVSLDIGVMQKSARIATIAADFEWDDVGSWTAVGDHLPRRGENAVGPGAAVEAVEAAGNVVLAPGRRVALIGVQGLAVVDDREGLLVCQLAQDQKVREVAQRQSAVKTAEMRAPSQDREIDVLLCEPPAVNAETGFLLVLHGFAQSRRQFVAEMERWAARYNLVCVAPEYRDSGLDVSPLGTGHRVPYDLSHLQLVDCLNAYRAARLRYPQADAGRRLVWGHSQGGHLALLAAEMAPRTFAGCVALAALAYVDPPRLKASGLTLDEAGRAIRDARRWAPRLACPVVLAHGTADRLLGEQHVRDTAAALAAAGKDVTVRFVPGADHAFGPLSSCREITEQLADELLRLARRAEADDFEAGGVSRFTCPGKVEYRLNFAGGLARFERSDG